MSPLAALAAVVTAVAAENLVSELPALASERRIVTLQRQASAVFLASFGVTKRSDAAADAYNAAYSPALDTACANCGGSCNWPGGVCERCARRHAVQVANAAFDARDEPRLHERNAAYLATA